MRPGRHARVPVGPKGPAWRAGRTTKSSPKFLAVVKASTTPPLLLGKPRSGKGVPDLQGTSDRVPGFGWLAERSAATETSLTKNMHHNSHTANHEPRRIRRQETKQTRPRLVGLFGKQENSILREPHELFLMPCLGVAGLYSKGIAWIMVKRHHRNHGGWYEACIAVRRMDGTTIITARSCSCRLKQHSQPDSVRASGLYQDDMSYRPAVLSCCLCYRSAFLGTKSSKYRLGVDITVCSIDSPPRLPVDQTLETTT